MPTTYTSDHYRWEALSTYHIVGISVCYSSVCDHSLDVGWRKQISVLNRYIQCTLWFVLRFLMIAARAVILILRVNGEESFHIYYRRKLAWTAISSGSRSRSVAGSSSLLPAEIDFDLLLFTDRVEYSWR